jgi:hypothetical protein
MYRACSLLLLFCCASCGFQSTSKCHTKDMAGAAGSDLARSSPSDGASSTYDLLGVPPGTDLAAPSKDNCGHPQLLVAVENLHDPNSGALGGKVARLALGDGSKLPTSCATLSASALIDAHPLAVTWVPPSSIAAATSNGLYVLNPTTDTILWKNSDNPPLDVFTMHSPSGATLVALVISNSAGTGSDGSAIHTYDLMGNPVNVWKLDVGIGSDELPIGIEIWSITPSPLDPSHLFAAGGSTNSPAWDVDTINKTKSSYRPDNGTTMGTIYSIASKRTAWSTKYQKPSAVYYTSEPNTTTTALSGPIRCTPGCDTILHVVPDPTESDRFLALCDAATMGGPRQIVRFTTAGGACEKVIDDAALGIQLQMARLAIAP